MIEERMARGSSSIDGGRRCASPKYSISFSSVDNPLERNFFDSEVDLWIIRKCPDFYGENVNFARLLVVSRPNRLQEEFLAIGIKRQ